MTKTTAERTRLDHRAAERTTFANQRDQAPHQGVTPANQRDTVARGGHGSRFIHDFSRVPVMLQRKRIATDPEIHIDPRTNQIVVDDVSIATINQRGAKGSIKIDTRFDDATSSLQINIVSSANVDVTLTPAAEQLGAKYKKVRINVTHTDNGPAQPKSIQIEARGPVAVEQGQSTADMLSSASTYLATVKPEHVDAADEPQKDVVQEAAVAVTDVITDFTPGVSNVKDAVTALTGFNPLTGDEVGVLGRVLAGIFAIPALGNILKYIGKGGKFLLKGIVALPKVVKTLGRALAWLGRGASGVLKKFGKWTAEKAGAIWESIVSRFSRKGREMRTQSAKGAKDLKPSASTSHSMGTGVTKEAEEKSLENVSSNELAKMIGKEQSTLLWKEFFGKNIKGAKAAAENFRIPAGLTRQTLVLYREIALRAIKEGIDKQGVQAVRLELIERALKIMK